MFLIQSKPITTTSTSTATASASASASAMVTITRKTFSIKFYNFKKN